MPLAPYASILAAWAGWDESRSAALDWDREACLACWRKGVPLLAEAPPAIAAVTVEPLVEAALDALASAGVDGAGLGSFADAWDSGEFGPVALLPQRGRIGAARVLERTGLAQEALAFLSLVCLRPPLERYFTACRSHLETGSARVWDLGVCPCCGAPPGFTDLLEDGQRRLACHLCGAGWVFSRLRCPHCGSQDARDFVRLLAEDRDEGYAIFACRACRGYVKELDRRLRWNGGAALVEDWGSPHLDLVARRQGYWRAVPTLLLAEPTE